VCNPSATILSPFPSLPRRGIRTSELRTTLSLACHRIATTTAATVIHVVRLAEVWRHFNSELDRLDRMSDRELAGRGISRSDVIRCAMEHSER
jgi:uncharacterized protein YjiS (DUF1127 family)